MSGRSGSQAHTPFGEAVREVRRLKTVAYGSLIPPLNDLCRMIDALGGNGYGFNYSLTGPSYNAGGGWDELVEARDAWAEDVDRLHAAIDNATHEVDRLRRSRFDFS